MPPKILINQDPLHFKNVEKLLNTKNSVKIKIIKPLTGEKFKHIKLAEKNANESIKIKKASLQNHQLALRKLKDLLKLNDQPKRIEVYDNSHTFGKNQFELMIVVDEEGLVQKL